VPAGSVDAISKCTTGDSMVSLLVLGFAVRYS
jgi:hypothetical protein